MNFSRNFTCLSLNLYKKGLDAEKKQNQNKKHKEQYKL